MKEDTATVLIIANVLAIAACVYVIVQLSELNNTISPVANKVDKLATDVNTFISNFKLF